MEAKSVSGVLDIISNESYVCEAEVTLQFFLVFCQQQAGDGL
jgi:hypothetical protein